MPGTHKGQKRTLAPLGLELQMVTGAAMWILRIELPDPLIEHPSLHFHDEFQYTAFLWYHQQTHTNH